jgi:hypothetical protein
MTHNVQDFARITDLRVVDWMTPDQSLRKTESASVLAVQAISESSHFPKKDAEVIYQR